MKPAQRTLHHITAISLAGMIVGLVAAFATAGFVELVQYLNDKLFISTLSRASMPAGELAMITIAVLTFGGLIVGLLLHYGVSSKASIGPADTIFAIQLHEKLPTPRCGLASTLAAMLSLGCGASVGQYGPLVYLGTLIGQLSNRLPLNLPYMRSITIACGVAAAISTAFNAPIAALIFTHEVILRHYSLRMFTAVTIASACGYFVANVVFDHPPLFLFDIDGSFRAIEFLLFAIEGIACGVLAVLLMKALKYSTQLSTRVKIAAPLKPMLAGFVTALIALQVPEVLGAGQDVFREAILGNSYGADTLLLILTAKLLVTLICIGFGFAGGVIFPALLVGVLFGALFATSVPELLLNEYSGLSVYAICGMVAVASPVIGAPMTALLIIFELTRSYEITIAAMVTVVFSNLVAYHWYGRSLFDIQLAERGLDLSLGRDRAYLKHQQVIDHMTQALPRCDSSTSCGELNDQLKSSALKTAVVIDADEKYLGLVYLDQLGDCTPETNLVTLVSSQGPEFDETTSLWSAMQAMRDYIGEAIPVVDSVSGRYLGAMPESILIGSYLDAVLDLRREEHEA